MTRSGRVALGVATAVQLVATVALFYADLNLVLIVSVLVLQMVLVLVYLWDVGAKRAGARRHGARVEAGHTSCGSVGRAGVLLVFHHGKRCVTPGAVRRSLSALNRCVRRLSLPFALLVPCERALADAPLRPPAKYTVCSSNQAFCAVADPAVQSVSIFPRGASTATWSITPWHRQVFLANDGDHLVIGPPGLNLIPLEAKLRDPLLIFMNRKATVRVVTVGDLFPTLSSLRRTASHYVWGEVVGVTARNQLVVRLVDGRRVAFSVLTGLQETEK